MIAPAAVLGGVVYNQLSHKMDDVRIEHVQAVTRHVHEQSKAVSLDPAQANPSDVKVIVKDDEKR